MLKTNKNVTRISSLQRALSVLDFLATNPDGYGVKEIAYGININISTCYHILNTLCDEQYVSKKADGNYILGTKIPYLNHTFKKSITPDSIILKHLHELNKISEETSIFVGVNDGKIILQSIIEGIHALRVYSLHEGYVGNEHARSACKAILAYWSDEKVEDFLSNHTFTQFTEKTPKNLTELQEQLKIIRHQGYCLDEEEFTYGICCVSSPVFGLAGKVVGSYSLTVPTARYTQKKQEFIDLVTRKAKNVSDYIKYL